MVIYFTTEKAESGEFLKNVLLMHGARSPILLETNGKPYLGGGEAEFSLTHTEGLTAAAVGLRRVGIDAENRRRRKTDSVVSRLLPYEREEDFFELWTAKEAYVKYLGGTLAHLLPDLSYKKGALLYKGARLDVFLKHFELADCTCCVCTEQEEDVAFVRL